MQSRVIFIVQGSLSVVFAASYSTYLFDLSPLIQLGPIVLLVFCGALALIVVSSRRGTERLLTKEVLGILVILPILTAIPSFMAEVDPAMSSAYWLLIILVLWSCRGLIVVLGMERILQAFFFAGLTRMPVHNQRREAGQE